MSKEVRPDNIIIGKSTLLTQVLLKIGHYILGYCAVLVGCHCTILWERLTFYFPSCILTPVKAGPDSCVLACPGRRKRVHFAAAHPKPFFPKGDRTGRRKRQRTALRQMLNLSQWRRLPHISAVLPGSLKGPRMAELFFFACFGGHGISTNEKERVEWSATRRS